METKGELRKFYRATRFSVENREERTYSATQNILKLPQWKEAKTVLLYNAIGSELSTESLFQKAIEQKKTVLLPVTLNLEGKMSVGYWKQDKLTEGHFAIPEPAPLPHFNLSLIDLVIVPGVAFDRMGGRLGQGKGYYDRFLSTTESFRIGFCFAEQLASELPMRNHDARMDSIVTESGIITCGG